MSDAHDAEHWQKRAEEALVVAEGMKDPEARRIMENIAAGYRNLAEQAERGRARSSR